MRLRRGSQPARSRASSPCIPKGRSINVMERNGARQTREPFVSETVPQLGRLARPSLNPNSCQGGHPGGQPESARTGESGKSKRAEYPMTDEARRSIGIDVSQATLDVAVYPTGELWQTRNDETGIAHLLERVQALAPDRIVLEATAGYEVPV